MNRVLNKLSEYIYFYISKNIISYTFVAGFQIVESLQCILNIFKSAGTGINLSTSILSTLLFLFSYFKLGESRFLTNFDVFHNLATVAFFKSAFFT